MTDSPNNSSGSHDQRITAVAASWLKATAQITFIPLSQRELRHRFEQLAARTLAAVAMVDQPEAVARHGRDIGRELVAMNLLKPEALERTLSCLSEELAGAGSPEPLGRLLSGIAGGFAEATESALLFQQETISRAATFALQQMETELLEQVAERTRAEEAQRAYAVRLKRLREIDLAILSAESIDAIVNTSVEHIQRLIPAITIALSIFDLEHNRSIILSSTHPAYPPGRDLEITMIDTLNRLGAGEVIHIQNLNAIRHISAGVAEIADLGGRSMMVVPLRSRTELIGGLAITLAEVRPFTDTEKVVAQELADSVAIAIQNRRLLEAEQMARERETTLREVAAALTLGLSRDELLDLILDRLTLVIPSYSSSIMLLEDGRPAMAANHGGMPTTFEHFNAIIASRPLTIWTVVETAEPQIINDTHNSPDWEIVEGLEYVRAWIGIPLLVKGTCIGVLTIDRDTPNSFTERDKELAMAFANQVAIGIDNARLFAQQQAHAGELEQHVFEATRDLNVLYGITETAVSNPDLDMLLRRSMSLTVNAFGCMAAVVHLLEPQEEKLRLAAFLNNGNKELGKLLTDLDPHSAILLHPLDSGMPEYISGSALPDEWGIQHEATLATVPLRSRGRNLGVLSLLCNTPGRLTGIAPDLLTTIADQIGAAVENIRLNQLTRQSAIIEERERLARDIHDQVTQSIYSATLFAEAARGAAEVGNLEKVQQHTRSILRMTNQAMRELRLLLFEFRTEALARKGLVDALRERLKTVEHRAAIAGEVHAADIGNLPVAIEEAFYRIALEALNNSLRHARADQVDIILMVEDNNLIMTIVDNGIGFDGESASASGGMGLEGMHKRIRKVGGSLTLSSNQDGTWVMARAPLEQESAES